MINDNVDILKKIAKKLKNQEIKKKIALNIIE